MKEPAVTSLEDDVQDHLLGDRVADLHGPAGDRFALAGQLGRAEGGPVDAVAAGPSTDGDDPVAQLNFLESFAPGQHAHGAAEYQRVGQVARVDRECPIHRGNAHPVAVVANAGHDSLEHALGMEHAGGKPVGRQVGRGHAEDVGVADGLGSQARAQSVANDAADSRV